MSKESLEHIEEDIKHHHTIDPNTEPEYYETEINLGLVRHRIVTELGAEAIKEAI